MTPKLCCVPSPQQQAERGNAVKEHEIKRFIVPAAALTFGLAVCSTIWGGHGNNPRYSAALDYSNVLTAAMVNLKTHTATGAGGAAGRRVAQTRKEVFTHVWLFQHSTPSFRAPVAARFGIP